MAKRAPVEPSREEETPESAGQEPPRKMRLFGWERVPGGYVPVSSDGTTLTRHTDSPQPLEYALGTIKRLLVASIIEG